MKIHEYNEMMAHLTRRRSMSNGGLSTVTANIRGKPVTYQRKSKLGQIDTKRRNIIKQFILDDIENFEKNLRKFPNEKYQLNKTKIVEKLRDNNINTSRETVDDVIKSISPKDKKRFSVIETGQSSLSSLPDVEQDLFAKNYRAKTISQMATEITGKPYDNKTTKAKTAQLYRHYLSQIKLGNIAAEDVPKGTRPKGTVPKEELKTFENYRKAQKNLMNLDPKTYKDLTPSMLDNRIRKALQFSTVRGAFDVPQSLAPSFEHFQGLVPSTIIKDPEGLRKTGVTTRDYNFNVMGAKAKRGMYDAVKKNLRTAKEFLNQDNVVEAKKSLGTVNEIYDDIAKKLKYVDRKKLPKYSLSKDGIRETNLKTVDIGTEKRLGNTIEDYIRFVAAGPKKDVAKIKQPNLAKAVEMIQKGEDKAVKELVKSRLPDVRAGQLFANPMTDPTLVKQGLDEITRSPAARNLLRGASRVALGETFFLPASVVLDTYAGLTPAEMALNVATFGAGVPLKDSVQKRKYIADAGFGSDYSSALQKRRIAKTAPKRLVGELTEREKQAMFLSNAFEEGLRLKREEQAEAYEQRQQSQLKRGELEVPDTADVPEEIPSIKPEFQEETTETRSLPFGLDRLLPFDDEDEII